MEFFTKNNTATAMDYYMHNILAFINPQIHNEKFSLSFKVVTENVPLLDIVCSVGLYLDNISLFSLALFAMLVAYF